MAYLSPQTLTCGTCGFSGQIEIVVGVGPSSEKGDVPYKKYRKAGPFVSVEPENNGTERQLACPEDGTIVWSNKPGRKA